MKKIIIVFNIFLSSCLINNHKEPVKPNFKTEEETIKSKVKEIVHSDKVEFDFIGVKNNNKNHAFFSTTITNAQDDPLLKKSEKSKIILDTIQSYLQDPSQFSYYKFIYIDDKNNQYDTFEFYIDTLQ